MTRVIGFEVSASEASWLDSAVVLGAKAINVISHDQSGSRYVSKFNTDIDEPNERHHELRIRKGEKPFVRISAVGIESRPYANVGTVTFIGSSSQAGSDYQTPVYVPPKLVAAAMRKERDIVDNSSAYLLKKATFIQLPTEVRRKLEPNANLLFLPPQIVIARQIVRKK